MEEFFAKMGNKKLKFKPAFNPYTEVSHLTTVNGGADPVAKYGDFLVSLRIRDMDRDCQCTVPHLVSCVVEDQEEYPEKP